MAEKTVVKKDRFPAGRFLAWSGRGISVAGNVIVLTYLSIFCTDTLGLAPALVGILFMVSKVIDAITDLVAGYVIDNTKTRFGKARPYEFCIILLWLCTWLLYSCPTSWSYPVKAIWVFFMYMLVNSVWATFLNIAEQPYTVRAWGTKELIVKVSSLNGILVTLGAMVVSVSFPILMGSIATSSAGWSKLLAIYAIPLAVLGMMRFLFVKEDPKYDETHKVEPIKPKEILVMLGHNQYAWYMGGITGMVQMILGMSAATYYFTWIVGDISKYGTLQILSVVTLLFLVAMPPLIRKLGIADTIRFGAIIGIVGYAINYFAGTNMPLLIIVFIISGIASLPISYMQAPMLMDVSTYNEHKGFSRMDAASASAMNFINKVCNGIGSALLGVLLSLGGYAAASETQSAEAMTTIRLLYSLVPMILMFVAIFCATKFRKLTNMIPQIEKELDVKRKALTAKADTAAAETASYTKGEGHESD